MSTTTPHDLTAEQAVLGAIVHDPGRAMPVVESALTPGDFFHGRHAALYEIMLSVWRQHRVLDDVMLLTAIRDRGQDKAIENDYLLELIETVPSAAMVEHHAGIVESKARARRALDALERATTRLRDGGDADEVGADLRADLDRQAGRGSSGLAGDALVGLLDRGLAEGFGFDSVDLSFLMDPSAACGCPLMVGRGLVTLIGGAPGQGKSALAEQAVFGLLARHPDMRALIANVELTPPVLIARQLARLTAEDGKPVNTLNILRNTLYPGERERVARAADQLRPLLARLSIVTEPRCLRAIQREVEAHKPDLIVADYIQRITADPEADARINAGLLMGAMRDMADAGRAVVAVSALSRSKGGNGSTYHGSSIASFRESSEVEYGADQAVIIDPGDGDGPVLNVVKSRYGTAGKFLAHFYGSAMTWQIGGAA